MDQIVKFINGLNSAQRAVIIGGFSILFLFLLGLLIYSNIKTNDAKLNYTIASKLTKNQIMLASNELDSAGIPFAIVGNGNSLTLKTNKSNINIAKIKLVTSEAIVSKHNGWEIFDKSSLGTTNFENNVKFLRATEGELGRSLESLSSILNATVKIAIPKESVFTQRKTLPTASAILTTRDGINISHKQIQGIKNFIASAIPKLKPQNIKLINQNGSLLEETQESINNLKFISHEKYKTKVENKLEQKILELLNPVIGIGRVVAKVTVSLDYTNQLIEEEIFEPEGTIRSQQNTESTSSNENKKQPNSGVPGVQNNIQNPVKANENIKSKSNNENAKTITNYEISKKIIHQKDNAFAKIQRITAAVTFDDTVMDKIDKKEKFISNIKFTVENAIGVNNKRGDIVTINSFKFLGFDDNNSRINNELVNDTSISSISTKLLISDFSEYIQYLFTAILLFIFYKKFITNNEINLSTKPLLKDIQKTAEDEEFEYDDFNPSISKNRLKNKIRKQLLENIEGVDPEMLVQYEILLEELENEVKNSPETMAKMIEMLLSEGNQKIKGYNVSKN
jgi:flagellar M-ring protein FliF